MLAKKSGISTRSTPIPKLRGDEQIRLEVSLLPLRRGYIQLDGFIIYRLDPLGLIKNELFFDKKDKTLVLPRIFPVKTSQTTGSRKYHQGGITAANSSGDTGEFASLREYTPGDPVKHIDWKATARSHELIVRQYQDEYFSRYGVVLDTFSSPTETNLLEDAISIAASVVLQQDATTNLIDLLFACDTVVSSVSSGRGQATQFHMLEVLACVNRCTNRSFSDLAKQVMSNLNVISGLVVILVRLDENRKNFLKLLTSNNIIYTALLVTKDVEKSRKQIAQMDIDNIKIFDTGKYPKIVEL